MAFNALYDTSNYVNPISGRPSVRLNGIDLRAFGLELLTAPDLLLPPTSQRNFTPSGVSGSIPFGDNYSNWNFSLDFNISAKSYHDLQKRKLDFYSWLHNQTNNFVSGLKSESVKGLLFELIHNNDSYTFGTVSNSANSKTVTGTDTKFLSYVSPGVSLEFSGSRQIHTVAKIVSDTEIELSEAVSNAHSSVSYRIERRKYLVVNYDGSSSIGAISNVGFLKPTNMSHAGDFSEHMNIGFYSTYPYWIGDLFTKEYTSIASGLSGYSSQDFGGEFLEVEGVGTSTLRPTIVFEGQAKSPKIADGYQSFSSNFKTDTKARGIFNTDKTATVTNNFLYGSSTSNTGAGSILVTDTDTSKILPNNWTYSSGLNNPYSEIGSIINFHQGHLNVWLRPSTATNDDRYVLDTGNYNLNVYYDTSESRFVAKLYDATAYVEVELVLDQWYNLQVSWDKSQNLNNLVVYVDNMVGYDTFTNTHTMSTDIGIGHDSSGNNTFMGYLDDFTIWDRVLSGSDIYSLQYGGLSENHQSQSIKFKASDEYISSGLIKSVSHIRRGWSHHINSVSLLDSSSNHYAINTSEERIKTSPTKNREFQVGDDVIVYDDTGMKTYGVVSDNFDGDTVHIRKDNFISSQHTQLNYHERASLPNPDQVGTHCQFDGTTGGKYFSGCSKMLPKGEKTPYMAISFWTKLDKGKTIYYGVSGDDAAYLFHKIKGQADKYRGWGFAFDQYWNPSFIYHRLKSNANKVSKSATHVNNSNRVQDGHGDWIIGTYENNDSDYTLNNVRVNFPSGWSPSSNKHLKIKIIPYNSPHYSTPIFSQLVRESDNSVVFVPANTVYCKRGDSVLVTFDNTDASNSSTYTSIIAKEPDFTEKKTLSVNQNMDDDNWHHYLITITPNNPADYKYDDGRNYDEDVALSNYDVTMSIDGNFNSFTTITDVDLAPKETNPIIFGRNRIGMDDIGSGSDSKTFPGAIKDFRVWSSADTDFMPNIASNLLNARILAHDPCGKSMDWNGNQQESAWFKFNDAIESTQITDYVRDSSDDKHVYPVGFTNYNASGLRGVKSFISSNLIVDNISSNNNLGGWIASGDYIHSFDYNDYVHTVSIVDESGTTNQKSIKLTPSGSGYNSKGLTQFITAKHTGADGYSLDVDYDKEYVFRCHSKRSTSTDMVVSIDSAYAEIDGASFTTNSNITYGKQSYLSDYELQELSFSLNDSSNSHNSFLINLHYADTSIDTHFTGMELYNNLITNGGFTYDIAGNWSNISSGLIDRNGSYNRSGDNCLQVFYPAEAKTSNINIIKDLYYEFSFWARGSTSNNVELKVNDGDTTTTIATESVSTSYKRYSIIWKSTATTANAYFTFSGSTSGHYLYIDDVVCLPRELIEHQRANTVGVSSELLYNSSIHSYAIDLTNDQSIYYDDIVGNRKSGAFSLTIKLEDDFGTSPSDNVLFSWFSDYSNSINYNDYIRLVRDTSDTWKLESNRSGNINVLAQGSSIPDEQSHVMGWWDSEGVFDDKDGLVYYAKLMINGYIVASSTTDISSYIPDLNLKHLYLASHGASTGSTLFTRGVFDQALFFTRSIPDDDLRSIYTKNAKMLNNRSGFSYSDSVAANDILTHKFRTSSSELYESSTYRRGSASGNISGGLDGFTVKNEKAFLYLKTDSDGSTTNKMKIIYRPHFR